MKKIIFISIIYCNLLCTDFETSEVSNNKEALKAFIANQKTEVDEFNVWQSTHIPKIKTFTGKLIHSNSILLEWKIVANGSRDYRVELYRSEMTPMSDLDTAATYGTLIYPSGNFHEDLIEISGNYYYALILNQRFQRFEDGARYVMGTYSYNEVADTKFLRNLINIPPGKCK